MSRLNRIVGGFQGLFRRRAADADLDEELRTYIADAAEDKSRAGMDPSAALRAARVEMGSLAAVKDDVRDAGWESILESLAQDVRYGLRSLRKSPGFATVAVLTLALGIGANAAISGAAYSILLKPLEYNHSDRLVVLWGQTPAWPRNSLSLPELEDVRARATAFDDVAGVENQSLWIKGPGPSAELSVGRVTGNFLPLLGLKPALGRWILPTDEQQGHGEIVVLSYSFWQKQFSGDPKILGKSVVLTDYSGQSSDYEVVGVLSPQFASSGSGWLRHGIYVPLVPSAGEKIEYNAHSKLAIGRLKQGVTLDEANAQLRVVGASIAQQHAGTNRDWTVHAEPLREWFVNRGRSPLLVLIGAVGFVFLIACLNVSNLMLYRGWSRRREIGIRRALGASRFRVVRQFVIESLLLALLGCALGVLLAIWGVDALRAIAPASTPRVDQLRFDPVILWYSVAISVIAGVVFGLLPAWQVARSDVQSALKQTDLSSAASRETRYRARYALIVAEFALAVVLLTGSVLLIRSFFKLTSLPTGFRADHVLTMWVNLEPGKCGPKDECPPFFDQMLATIRALPGVENAAVAPFVLDSGMKENFWVAAVEGHGVNPGTWPALQTIDVSPGYFDTLGIPIVRGREFTNHDREGSAPVAIVNDAFARQYFGGSAIGKHLALGLDKSKQPEWIEIIGQVGDARDVHRWEAPGAAFYRPMAQTGLRRSAGILVRSPLEPKAIASFVQKQIWAVDKGASISEPETLRTILWRDLAEPRFRTELMSAFGLLALLLAAIGIYGVIAFVVTQRTHEVGVRMALGARTTDIARLVLHEGLLLAAGGTVIGLAAALGLTRYLRSLLFEIAPLDPWSFAIVSALLIGVALFASFIPARRASRVDPMNALRAD